MFYEVGGFSELPRGKNHNSLMMIKKIKQENKCGESRGLIGMSISTDLQFHISGIDEPDKAWEKLEVVSGKHNENQGHQL